MSLVDVLHRYPPSEHPTTPPTPLGSAGGLSGSRLWRYQAPNGPRVLKGWPTGTSLDRIIRIHGWLKAASGLPFLACPIATADGATAIESGGRCWELAAWLPGETATGGPTAARVREGFHGLAELHLRLSRVEASIGPSPGLAARRDELHALIAGGFDLLAAAVATRPDDPCASAALTWLDLARRLAPGVLAKATAAARLDLPLQPCLRDARPEHFLFTGDALTGLVDFGAMDVESPAADRARLVGEWLPRGACDDLRGVGLGAYAAVRPITDPEAVAASAFEELADVLIAERWIRWKFLEGRPFEDDQAFASGIARGLSRLRRLAAGGVRPEAGPGCR